MRGIPVGTKLGRYEVVKPLTWGGMAEIVLAKTTGIGGFAHHVVIKQLVEHLAEDESFVNMFVTEARLVASLHHHNIVQVHDIGETNGRHYFAMEYVHGEDLRRLLARIYDRGELMPIEHVVSIGSRVAAALHHAHEHRGPDRELLHIVHRDVSPSNILVAYDGNVKVTDFGVAKAKITVTTAAGTLKGSAPYMSPEQCKGEKVDRRSDVFALGVVLYEMATLRRLFKGDNEYFIMAAVVSGEIPPPSATRKDLPQGLEAIIMKALARSPADRYQTAEAFGLALEEFALASKQRSSATALADYMRRICGAPKEPWLVSTVRTQDPAEFDTAITGLVEPPEDIFTMEVPTAKDSPLVQARIRAIVDTGATKQIVPPKPKSVRPIAKGDPADTTQTTAAPPRAADKPKPAKLVLPLPGVAKAAATPEPSLLDATTLVDPPVTTKLAVSRSYVMEIATGRPPSDADTPPLKRAVSEQTTELDIGNTTGVTEVVSEDKTEVSVPPPPRPDRARTREPTELVKALPKPSERARRSSVPPAVFADGTKMEPIVVAPRRRWIVALGAGVVLIATLITVFVMSGRHRAPELDVEPAPIAATVPEPEAVPAPARDPEVEEPRPRTVRSSAAPGTEAAEPDKQAAKPEPPKPEPPKPEPLKPEPLKPEPPKPEPPKPEPPKPEPPKPEPATAPESKPRTAKAEPAPTAAKVTAKPAARPAAKPVAAKKPKPVEAKKIAKPEPKPEPKEVAKPAEPKPAPGTWNPNKLFPKKKTP